MEKICINSRDELLFLDLSIVAFFKADDDYTTVCYMSGVTTTLSLGLNKVEIAIAAIPKSNTCNFVRLGRSIIINQHYLYQIQVLSQKIVLFDGQRKISITVSKDAIKRYKQHLTNRGNDNSPTKPYSSPQME